MESNGDAIALSLPSLSEDDPLFMKKKKLLRSRDLKMQFRISDAVSPEEANSLVDEIVRTARVLHLNEVELYFVEDDDVGPFSPRNELESLNFILEVIGSLLHSDTDDKKDVLQLLQNKIFKMIDSIGDQYAEKMVQRKVDSEAEQLLLDWGKTRGVKTKLNVAFFEGAGRGAVALEDINIGETALEIPEDLIISEDLVYESDMLHALKKVDGITAETMLLLWSMRERYNSNSKFRAYFETLPEDYNTGLRFGVDALSSLEGTLLFEELLQAREHLRRQYDELCPALCTSYPDIFQADLYSWKNFLWACELWYSNSLKVVFADGKLRTCLVPIAGFLNHSICPHILHYGRVDPLTKSLKFRVSRSCKEGEQCYLSYGSFPNSHLITFYGFLPRGENPFDVIPLEIDAPPVADGWSTHMVRGTWLSKNCGKPPTFGLPPPLLDYLYVILAPDDTEHEPSPQPSSEDVSKENRRAALETIESIFNSMMEGSEPSEDIDWEKSSWDVRLAWQYRGLQRRIVSSVLDASRSGLQMLDS